MHLLSKHCFWDTMFDRQEKSLKLKAAEAWKSICNERVKKKEAWKSDWLQIVDDPEKFSCDYLPVLCFSGNIGHKRTLLKCYPFCLQCETWGEDLHFCYMLMISIFSAESWLTSQTAAKECVKWERYIMARIMWWRGTGLHRTYVSFMGGAISINSTHAALPLEKTLTFTN